MKVLSFKCPACLYESKLQVGTPDTDQILTDVNTEFAHYKLYVCKKEKKFVHIDEMNANFDGRCPVDASELEEVDPQQASCPRCNKELQVQEINPFAPDSSTE